MLHEGDGMGLSVDRPGVVDPIGALAPAVGVLVARAIEHVAFSLGFVGAFDAHGFGDPDRRCTFFGVAERYRLLRREFYGEIDGARGWCHGVEAKGLFRDKMHLAVLLSDPFLRRLDGAGVFASFGFDDASVFNSRIAFQSFDEPFGFAALGPEIEPVHIPMGEPERAVMRVVMVLSLGLLHRVGSGEPFSARTDHRVIENVWRFPEVVRGEHLAIDAHHDAIRFSFHLDISHGEEWEGCERNDR